LLRRHNTFTGRRFGYTLTDHLNALPDDPKKYQKVKVVEAPPDSPAPPPSKTIKPSDFESEFPSLAPAKASQPQGDKDGKKVYSKLDWRY
jgi:hypothetical protein